jgi:hypothetical protein
MNRETTNVRLLIPAYKTHKDTLKIATNQPLSVEKEAAIFCSKQGRNRAAKQGLHT